MTAFTPFGALSTFDKIDGPSLDFQVYGNPTSSVTVFMVAGWPDTQSVFRNNLVDLLENSLGDNNGEGYRIVGITMPGYQHKRPANTSHYSTTAQPCKAVQDMISNTPSVNTLQTPFFGYPLLSVVQMLQKTMYLAMTISEVERTEAGITGAQKRPSLIGHDWGSIMSQELLLSHPFFFDRVVLLDVGNNSSLGKYKEDGNILKRKIFYLFYQSFIMLVSYLLPGFISRRLLSVFTSQGQRPNYKDVVSGKPVVANWKMAWMYIRVYFELSGGAKTLKSLTKRLSPSVPMMFLYSSPAPHIRFHSTAFTKLLEERGKADGKSKVISVRGGHWFFARPATKFDSERQHIIDFIRDGRKVVV